MNIKNLGKGFLETIKKEGAKKNLVGRLLGLGLLGGSFLLGFFSGKASQKKDLKKEERERLKVKGGE